MVQFLGYISFRRLNKQQETHTMQISKGKFYTVSKPTDEQERILKLLGIKI